MSAMVIFGEHVSGEGANVQHALRTLFVNYALLLLICCVNRVPE